MINQNFFQSITENAIKYCPELQSWPDQYLLRAQELKLLLKDFHLTTKVPTLLEIGCGKDLYRPYFLVYQKSVSPQTYRTKTFILIRLGLIQQHFCLKN